MTERRKSKFAGMGLVEVVAALKLEGRCPIVSLEPEDATDLANLLSEVERVGSEMAAEAGAELPYRCGVTFMLAPRHEERCVLRAGHPEPCERPTPETSLRAVEQSKYNDRRRVWRALLQAGEG